MSLLSDKRLEALLDRLHGESERQDEALGQFFGARAAAGAPLDPEAEQVKAFLADKLVALDRDKAAFCYQLCRALGARTVVEAGSSHGVSTLWLAAALRDNGGGRVIATEHEPAKAEAALANFTESGLSELIDLRVGDLRDTLRSIDSSVDFMLIDIWAAMARPALELVSPHLRRGAVILCDNTTAFRDHYQDYFGFLADSANRLSTMTLPFAGGLEMSVRT